MRSPVRRTTSELLNNPILVGTITLLVVVVAVYLSYIAENGLPFVPTYRVQVDVPNGSELVKNADVRIGGARVGQVLAINPEPADPSDRLWPHPFARLRLSLQKSLEPLPMNTHYQVRLASVLGGKYVELIPPAPGKAQLPGLPDGGTLTLARGLAEPFVDLDTAFDTFGPRTQAGIRHLVGSLGDALAGRGAQINDSIGALGRLLGPLQRLLGRLADPSTGLSQLLSGAANTTRALASAVPPLSALLADGAVTFGALQAAAPNLGRTIDLLAPTETVATDVFTRALPALDDAAAIAAALRPAAPLLAPAAQGLDRLVIAGSPVFVRVPALATNLSNTAAAAGRFAADPAAVRPFQILGSSDLATFGSSAFLGLGAILRQVADAQFACNVTGPWLRNFSSTLSEGDAAGTWVRFMPLFDSPQTFLSSKPAPDLHTDLYPAENAHQCQAGNERFAPGQSLENPGSTGTAHDATAPPADVLARGKAAGLVP